MKRSLFLIRIVIISLPIIVLSGCAFRGQPVLQERTEKPVLAATNRGNTPLKPNPAPSVPEKIYLIALEDNGKSGKKVGCGDSLVAVETQAKNSQEALLLLLDNHNQWYGQSGLYNALYQSTLTVSRWEPRTDILEIDLIGTLQLGGVCDNPRIKAQLEATIRQSTEDNPPVSIQINGMRLEEILSGK